MFVEFCSGLIHKDKRVIVYNEKPDLKFEVSFIYWNIKLQEYSKYYYIKSNDKELSKENTTLNNKGDRFYHSVYIKSSFFDNFQVSDEPSEITFGSFKTKNSPEFLFLMSNVNKILIDARRPFIREYVGKILESWEIEKAFPKFDESNQIDLFRKEQIEDLIGSLYIAKPKLFSGNMNREQKNTFIRLLDLTMQSGEIETLYSILNEILEMDSHEREELGKLLKYTKLSNITKTIRFLKDRFKAISDLKELVFNEDLGADEVQHLQSFIESHYWVFGEQYSLVTAAEPKFEEALRRHVHFLHKEYEDEDLKIEHPDKLKEMDIFAVRQNINKDTIDNIVVELKHPKILLGESQLSQVKKYMQVIRTNERFNSPTSKWNFYLVGNRFNTSGYLEGEIENNKQHGEQSLVYSVSNIKIYVKTWSEIFDDFEIRYNHIQSKLKIERTALETKYLTADEIIDNQENNTAVSPAEYSINKSNDILEV